MGDEENVDVDIDTEDEAGPQEDAGGGGGFKGPKMSPMIVRILLGFLLVAISVGISGMTAYFIAKSVTQTAPVQSEVSSDIFIPPSGEKASLGEFNQNTADADVPHFVNVSITVTYPKGNNKINSELTERQVELRDLIGELLAQKEYQELKTVEGRRELKKLIKIKINERLREGEIEEVYFDNFLVN